MNRKKILVCLNTGDDAILENEFIQKNLGHPYNMVIKFHLESILDKIALEPVLTSSSKKSDNNGSLAKQTVGQRDFHAQGISSNSKRQMIYSSSVKELLTECQFADLLVIRKSNFMSDCTHYGQNKALQVILKKAECPVLVIPDQISKIEQILLIYDGSSSALNSIKMMRTTLAPLCREIPVTVIIPCLTEANISPAQEKMMIEYLRIHFKDLGIHKVCEESAHTLQFAIYPDKNLLMVINNSNQALPDYLKDELEIFMQDKSEKSFQFLARMDC